MALKRRLKTVLVLGAGFSVPAGGPLLRDLLRPDDVAATTGLQSSLFDFATRLHRVTAERGQEVDLEREFTRIERATTMGQTYSFDGKGWKASLLALPLRRHIVRVCSGRVDLRRKRTVALYGAFLDHIFTTSSGLGIVTFNYDRLLEHFLTAQHVSWSYGDMGNLRYQSDRQRRRASRPAVPILKLHGSVTWGFCVGCSRTDADCLITVFEKVYRAKPRTPCARCRKLLDPGIVPPVQMKAYEASLMIDAWKHAGQLLRASERVVVVGYSLPPGDEEARTLLSGLGDGRREVTVVCGKGGATNHSAVMGDIVDTGSRLEDYVASLSVLSD